MAESVMVSDEMKSMIQECARKCLADANGDKMAAISQLAHELPNIYAKDRTPAERKALVEDIDRILRDGNAIYREVKRLLEQCEAQKKEPTVTVPKKALKDVADDLHSMATFRPKMPDYYAKLAGTKWTVVDEPFKPSAAVQAFLDASSSVRDSEYDDAVKRFSYISGKIRDGNIDIKGLPNLGSYLDVILWHTRETEQWEEYKKYYDEGIQLMELLSHMHVNDPLERLEDIIYGIARTYEGYKNIQC